MSAKAKGTIGSIFLAVGSLVTGGAAAYAWIWIVAGAALSYAGARQAQKEAERRARQANTNRSVQGNIRGTHEHHLMVFGKARVGGVVVASGTHTPTPNDLPNQDLYIGVAHSLAHPGGCEGIGDFWIDDQRIPYVAISGDPNNEIAYVSDSELNFTAVANDGRRFVAVGRNDLLPADKAAVSDDGIVWREYNMPLAFWSDIAWSPDLGIFLAIGGDGAGVVINATSPDGKVWTEQVTPQTFAIHQVTWGDGKFVAAATGLSSDFGIGGAAVSSDAVNWSFQLLSNINAFPQSRMGIAYSPALNRFAICAKSAGAAGTSNIWTSDDTGTTWVNRDTAEATPMQRIAWSPTLNLFAAMSGLTGAAIEVITGADGISWNAAIALTGTSLGSITWGADVFVIVGSSGPGLGGLVITSSDGTTWVSRTPAFNTGSMDLPDVSWNGSIFVAVAFDTPSVGQRVMTSRNGKNWTARDSFPAKYTNSNSNGVAIRHHRGTGTQVADATLVANGIDISTDYRRGVAWTWGRFRRPTSDADFSEAYKFLMPTLSVEQMGILCYDPRLDTTEGGSDTSDAHRHDDPLTWQWTDNPILHAATYSIMEEQDGGWGIPPDRIDWASVISAANICDELKDTPAGSRNLFSGNGVLLSSDKKEVNLQKLLDACMGRRVKSSGKFKFFAAAYRAPTFTLDDTWLAGGFKISTLDPLEATYNAVRVNYSDADLDYKTIDAPPYTNTDDESADGGVRVWRDLNLPMVSNTYDAQYLAQILGRKSRYQMTIDVICNLRAMDVEVFESGTVVLPGIDLSGRVFRIESWSRSRNGIAMTLQEDHASIYEVGEMQVPH